MKGTVIVDKLRDSCTLKIQMAIVDIESKKEKTIDAPPVDALTGPRAP